VALRATDRRRTAKILNLMADPPSSAISDENPPRSLRTYSRECRQLLAVDLHISDANASAET
jgi:hypothetical protein